MSQLEIAGVTVDVNDEGYMTDPSQWNKDIAAAFAEKLYTNLPIQ